jgi:predicted alpha-1,6-mannanase (GH76 family)
MVLRAGMVWRVSLAVLATVAGVLVVPAATAAATTVCAVYCDTRDPSLASQETFPVPDKTDNGRLVRLHVTDPDGMAWASVDQGQPGDQVWLDRSWDGGASWDGLLGMASIPGTWTGTRTLMYNLYDPAGHRRGLLRACANVGVTTCTTWYRPQVCNAYCDTRDASLASGDSQPVPATSIGGRPVTLHIDTNGMAWGAISNGRPGDEVWLDRSWNSGASWPDGSSLGRLSIPSGATATHTAMYNVSDTAGLLYGGAVRACGRAVEGQNGSCTAWARPATVRSAAAADALMYSYDPNTAWWPSSWWNSAATLTTLIDYLRATGDTRYRWVVDRTFQVNKGTFAAGVKSSDPIEGNFSSRAIDDTEWWGIAWLDAYDLTGNQAYLSMAVTIADYVNGYWDTTCGGGVWWDRERTYKNAVTNGLWIRLTAGLHNRIAGDTSWLSKARAGWTWFTGSGMINSSNLVNDGLTTSTCKNNGGTVYSYNQGLAFGAAVELWRATGDAATLATAQRLADAGTTSSALVTNGVLTESCDATTASCDDNGKQFKGVFMRYLSDLTAVTGSTSYRTFVQHQSDTLWSADRDTLNRFGERWSGADSSSNPNVRDWRTQASALAALIA